MNFSRLLIVIYSILVLMFMSGCSDPEKKREKHYKRAQEYIKIEDEKSAIIELKKAIQLDPKYADARYQLALLYLKAGDARKAFGELQRTTSIDPQNLDAGVKVAEFLLLSKNREESRKYVEQVLFQDPDYQNGLALLANLELLDGNFDKAKKTIDRAISLNDSIDKYYNIKGRILVAQKQMEEGEKNFLKAIELKPDYFANYKTLLLYYEQQQNESAVQQLLDHMTRKFPDNPQLHLMLSRVHQRKGKLEEAEQALLKAQEVSENAPSYRLLLAEFYKKTEKYDIAEETLRTALTDFPDDLQIQVTLGELLFELRKFDKAKNIMDSILESNPANGGANLIKARFMIKDNKYEEALEIITPLLSDYPKWSDPFYYSALSHLRIGKPELAQKSIELATQNSPAKDRYHALAAQIHLIRGNSSEASKEASIALRINPHNLVAVKILAKSFNQSKDFEKSLQLMSKLNPQAVEHDQELLESKAMAQLGLGKNHDAKKALTQLLKISPENSKALALLIALNNYKDVSSAIDFVSQHISSGESAGHYNLLGDLLVKNKEFDRALTAYQKAQILRPKDPRSYILSARLLALLGKTEDEKAKYQELLGVNPDSIPALMGLAGCYEKTGDLLLAKETYMQVLKLNPAMAAAANNLAWLIASEDEGDLGEALRLAMQAKQALPDQPHIADTLGWVHYQRNSYPLAITQFRQALEKRPGDPTINYHLALALHGNGDLEDAVNSLKSALDTGTDFPEKSEATALLQKLEQK